MKSKILIFNEDDNVAVAIQKLNSGESVIVNNHELIWKSDINFGHKVAIKEIYENELIYKNGFEIGIASQDINAGEWIHSHNLRTNLKIEEDYEYSVQQLEYTPQMDNSQVFLGYRRSNGHVGTRNEIWIINSVGCVNSSAEKIAKISSERIGNLEIDGIYTFSHPFGCSQLGDDLENTKRVLTGLIKHPNAGGVLVLGLGCENNRIENLIDGLGEYDKERLSYFNSQDVEDEIEEGVRRVIQLYNVIKDDRRESVPVSDLVIGVKCGGSDGLSGITANPLVGRVADYLTMKGGSVIQTEVPEMFGAEKILLKKAQNSEIFNSVISLINGFKEYYLKHDLPIYENPSPGNKSGGITTLEEKSLGAVQKGGNSVITAVIKYGEIVKEKGLTLLEAPGNDGISSTAMIVSGATIILFTTGRGTPLGFPIPTIKISTNTQLFQTKKNWIDFNAGELIEFPDKKEKITEELIELVVETASGKYLTKNEINNYREISIWKNGVTL